VYRKKMSHNRFVKGSAVYHRGTTGVIAPEAFVTERAQLHKNMFRERMSQGEHVPNHNTDYYPLLTTNQLMVRQNDCCFAFADPDRRRAHTALQAVQVNGFSSFNGLDPNHDEVVFFGTALTNCEYTESQDKHFAITKAGPVSYDFKGREDIFPGDLVIWDWPGRDTQYGRAVPVTRIANDIPGRFTAEFYPFKYTDVAMEFAVLQDTVLSFIAQANARHDATNLRYTTKKSARDGMFDLTDLEQNEVIGLLEAFDFSPFSLYRSTDMRQRCCPMRKYAFFFARAMGVTKIPLEMYDLSVKPRRGHRNPECRPDSFILDLLANTKHEEPKNFIDFMERSPLYAIEQMNLYRGRLIGRCQQTNGRGNQLNVVTGYV
jgi:hypothetical protein